jgi:hypothetical protein
MTTEKRELKFEGIDDWNRAIFKDQNNNRFGNTSKLLSWKSTYEQVRKMISENDIEYFGSTFGCEPEGGKINPDKIVLVKEFTKETV